MNQELFDEIEKLKAGGMTAKDAFAAHAAATNRSRATVQAAYYQHKKGLKPVEPETLAGQLRTLVAKVQDTEIERNQYRDLVEKMKNVGK